MSESAKLRRVLVVSPHFSPVNAPDMQRARMVLSYLRACGWEPVVLATAPHLVEGAVLEPILERTYPADVRVVRAGGVPARFTRWAGFGSLWWRCGSALRAQGDRLLAEGGFDLVFITTTFFEAFKLGPRWRKRFGVPYVLDYQDPWINDYYARTGTRPPGGPFKFGVSQWSARRNEPRCVLGASGIVTVSDAYRDSLSQRYPQFEASRCETIPFATDSADFELARTHRPEKPLIDFGDGLEHLVYTGRCGPDMSTSLRILFRAFRRFLEEDPERARKMRFEFIGTDYAPPPLGRQWAMPIAEKEGVAEFVREYCYRVPYFDCLYYLTRATALVAVGSNDPTYSASKIFPYVLAGRPLLVLYHEKSPVIGMARRMGCASCHAFSEAKPIETSVEEVHRTWFAQGAMHRAPEGVGDLTEVHTARAMTRQLALHFDRCVRP